jgi:hypothetical protein
MAFRAPSAPCKAGTWTARARSLPQAHLARRALSGQPRIGRFHRVIAVCTSRSSEPLRQFGAGRPGTHARCGFSVRAASTLRPSASSWPGTARSPRFGSGTEVGSQCLDAGVVLVVRRTQFGQLPAQAVDPLVELAEPPVRVDRKQQAKHGQCHEHRAHALAGAA